MIERSPEEYHKTLTYEEALIYCFSLNIDGKTGWRLPTLREIFTQGLYGWYTGDDNVRNSNSHGMVMPVRDIKDN
jgi:hypothetical protein